MDHLVEFALFIAGLIFGSFLNVCITRIPRDESIVRPPSHCRNCGAPVRWFDNIPVFSYLLLGSRCRACGAHISLRYPAVELLTGIVFAACYACYGTNWLTLKFSILSFLLIGLIFMDAETGLLVHEFTYPGIILGLAFGWIAPVDPSGTWFLLLLFQSSIASPRALSLLDSVVGALFGAGFLYAVWALYYLVRKRHGLGFGDMALMAMSGAFLGLKLAAIVVVCAPIVTLIYILGMLAVNLLHPARSRSRSVMAAQVEAERQQSASELDVAPSDQRPFLQREIPFGVFLGACSLAAIFSGEAAWRWYISRF